MADETVGSFFAQSVDWVAAEDASDVAAGVVTAVPDGVDGCAGVADDVQDAVDGEGQSAVDVP